MVRRKGMKKPKEKLLQTVNVRGVKIKMYKVTPTGLGAGRISDKRIKELLKQRGTLTKKKRR